MALPNLSSGPEGAKNLVQAGYDSIADTYLDWVLKLPSPRLDYLYKVIDLLTEPSQATVLELGCGAGLPCTEFLARSVGSVTANDISETQLGLARKHLQSYDNVKYLHGDMYTLDIGERSLDAVLGFYSLMHLPLEEQKGMMSRINGWLKPGGLLLVSLGDGDNPGITEEWLDGAKMFWASRDEKSSKHMVEEAGFDLIDARVVSSYEDEKTVPFLWVLARKS